MLFALGSTVSNRFKWIAGLLVSLTVGGLVLGKWLGFRNVDSPGHPASAVDYANWDDALGRWVIDGRVDYARVNAEIDVLHRFTATLAKVGPRTHPDQFKTDNDKLAYYINAYNALTLLGVTNAWPISSVQDVRGKLEPKAGFGFFYGLRFLLDGGRTNLYNFEHKVIRGFGDARIHAAINCASTSCPALAPFAYRPEQLDAQLDQVTRQFVSSPMHVRVDDDKKQIALSAIFDWYKKDFDDHAKALGKAPTVLAFIEHFADEATQERLRAAQTAGYKTVFNDYDWSLNSARIDP